MAVQPSLVFIAGSDAHGDFNYSVGIGWDYKQHGWINDNALGRARTVIHVPGHASNKVPRISVILAALKQGSCVVTDGPVIEFSSHMNGRTAYMGDALSLEGDGQAGLDVVVHTTPEFGPAEDVEVVTYTKGRRKKRRRTTAVKVGRSETILFDGARGYCRVETRTTGPDGERFCCFTNPIWLLNLDGKRKQLHVRVTQVQSG